ncbi:two-component system sensor histidine kinase NtrB [Paenibacillus alkalitolerans]|uniref:two-component system sensor histidine kinase NtrB n=1 Tax=Paenibacillus alkalitolerans TaxID=2799335 RepID=UPI002D7F16EB|nr:ATP-binding protein [Paenibacillus alkalitolerans]
MFKTLYNVLVPLYVIFIITSSFILQKAASEINLLLFGLLFLLGVITERNDAYVRFTQILLLSLFHWYSQLNWCYGLYLALSVKDAARTENSLHTYIYTIVGFSVYSVIRIAYAGISPYNLLVIVTDVLGSLGLIVLVRSFIETDRINREWKRQKLEDELYYRSEKLRLIGELAAGMAHEIRNPLTTVKGFLQLAKSNNDLDKWYKLIMDEINRMNDLTAEFLLFSRPSQSSMKILPIQACIERVIQLTVSEASKLGHQLYSEMEVGELYMLMDRDKIVQLFLNLIKNAFEAMEVSGTVAIKVTRDKQSAVVEVRDTGKGIPASQMNKLFDPFYTTKEYGTGLGLSICHKIVQDHQGTIDVQSVVNSGTVFTITFPLADIAE